MEGLFYQLAYFASRHYFGGWTLTRWAALSLLVAPFILLLPLRSQPNGLIIFGVIVLSCLLGLIAIWRVRRCGFLRFEPEKITPSVEPDPLPFPETISVRASGNFAVSGLTRYFVEEQAQYQTFQTRERVIMVKIAQTSFLFLIQSPEGEVGWWYSFFTPPTIRAIETGWLHFGRKARSALRLTCQPGGSEALQILYLTFDTPEQRWQILADLEADQINL